MHWRPPRTSTSQVTGRRSPRPCCARRVGSAIPSTTTAVWEKLARTTLDGIDVAPIGTRAAARTSRRPGSPAPRRSPGPAEAEARDRVGHPCAARRPGREERQPGRAGRPRRTASCRCGWSWAPASARATWSSCSTAYSSTSPRSSSTHLVRRFGRGGAPRRAEGAGRDPGRGHQSRRRPDRSAGSRHRCVLDDVTAVAALARDAGTLGVVVDASAVHDLGASDGQELGYSLAVGAAYLRALTDSGIEVDEALALMEFRYAATDEQFPTIAKLRAAGACGRGCPSCPARPPMRAASASTSSLSGR